MRHYLAIGAVLTGIVGAYYSGAATPPRLPVCVGTACIRWRVNSTQSVDSSPASVPTTDREAWAIDLLDRLGNTQPSGDIVAFVVAWSNAEDGSSDALDRFNPVNTIQDANGAYAINGVGVKGYPDYDTGMDATIETLVNGRYNTLVAGLQTNDVALALSGLCDSPWGTDCETVRSVLEAVSAHPQGAIGAKSVVMEGMDVYSRFDTVDCGTWGFQLNCQHWGTDILGSEGTPVYAPFDMSIIATGEYPPGPTWGQYVQGTLSDGYVLYLGHLQGVHVGVGQTVAAGTLLGYTNAYAHTHVQLAAHAGACAQDGSCMDFMQYYEEH